MVNNKSRLLKIVFKILAKLKSIMRRDIKIQL